MTKDNNEINRLRNVLKDLEELQNNEFETNRSNKIEIEMKDTNIVKWLIYNRETVKKSWSFIGRKQKSKNNIKNRNDDKINALKLENSNLLNNINYLRGEM